MATVIRLKRGGRKKKPYYRIVVQDGRIRTRGREVEILGVYHPTARPEPVSEVNAVRALEWLRQGAVPSDTVRAVFSKLGLMQHLHNGTTPEEEVAQAKHGAVVDKGYNAPPPPKPAPKPAPEPVAEEAVESGEAEVAEASAADAEEKAE